MSDKEVLKKEREISLMKSVGFQIISYGSLHFYELYTKELNAIYFALCYKEMWMYCMCVHYI